MVCVAIVAAALAPAYARDASSVPESSGRDAEVLIAWNDRVLAIAVAEDRLLTLKGVRTAAMMHIAIHDALNSIRGRYSTYASSARSPDADPVVAAAQAAYEVIVSEYPDQEAVLQAELQKWTSKASSERARRSARDLGKSAAAGILTKRRGDRWNSEAKYAWHPMAPGVYAEFREHSGTPEGFVFGAGWADARPFALLRADQFRVPPPPAIESAEYTAAFNEVKEVGAFQSSVRTPDQTHLAMWWKDFVESSHNRLARDLTAERHLDLWPAARMFALLNMNIFDAYVASFDNKFFYNHWRPYTAIRWAANDGNPRTEPDVEWNNTHRHTYPFPSYPSAHGTACAAAMKAFQSTFGDRMSFTMRTPEVDASGPLSEKIPMNPETRSFGSFSDAAMECAMSRVYLGIHFRYDSTEGNTLGQRIGDYSASRYLRPTQTPTR